MSVSTGLFRGLGPAHEHPYFHQTLCTRHAGVHSESISLLFETLNAALCYTTLWIWPLTWAQTHGLNQFNDVATLLNQASWSPGFSTDHGPRSYVYKVKLLLRDKSAANTNRVFYTARTLARVRSSRVLWRDVTERSLRVQDDWEKMWNGDTVQIGFVETGKWGATPVKWRSKGPRPNMGYSTLM